MNGPPQKPTTAWSGRSSARTRRIASRSGANASSGSGSRSRSTSASVRTGSATTGPTPSTRSTSSPSPITGVTMSANITAASTSCRRTGCSVTCAQSSGVFATSKNACRSRTARYSGSERPACRMNQTGVRSVGSRRSARTRRGSMAGVRVVRRVEGTPRRALRRLAAPGASGGCGRRTYALHVENGGTVAWRRGWGSASPTTGSTAATTRSCGTGCGRRRLRSSRAPRRRSRSACARRSRPGGYRLAFDMVAENRAWFSELGSEQLVRDVVVGPRHGRAADRPARLGRACDRLGRPHRGGARRGLCGRRRRDRMGGLPPAASARAVRPRPGTHARLRGAAPLPVGPPRGRARAARGRRRPAGVRAAARRAVGLRRADRAHSSTAIRSSTDLKTIAPSASATIAATTR